MSDGVLLDTCALIWIAEGADFEAAARAAVERAQEQGTVFVSAFSAWEVATLQRKGRISLAMGIDDWFGAFLSLPGVQLAESTWKVLAASAALPGKPPNDPVDRIICATARALNLPVVTRDRLILDYAASDHLRAIRC